jgi:hypothetical protein
MRCACILQARLFWIMFWMMGTRKDMPPSPRQIQHWSCGGGESGLMGYWA